ncbi:MAG: hypothetical protein Q9161_008865 [Pseudevernia consocians]
MHFLLTVLFSAATFSLSGLARPPPPPSSTGSATLAKRFASGWCGVHVVQYQKNEGPTNTPNGNADYRLDVNLADALQDPVGGVSSIDAPGGQFEDIDSQLPFVFEVEVGAQDADPVGRDMLATPIHWQARMTIIRVEGGSIGMAVAV